MCLNAHCCVTLFLVPDKDLFSVPLTVPLLGQEGPHHGGPDVLVGEEEVQDDVVHLAVVGTAEALPEEGHSLLVLSLGGVIEDQRSLQGMKLRQGNNRTGGGHCAGERSAGMSVGLNPFSKALDEFKVASQFPDKLVQGLLDILERERGENCPDLTEKSHN